jgi:repressor LexA
LSNKTLSKKQAIALAWIRDYTEQNPYSPSLAEIAEAMGVKSSSTARALVGRLQEKGYIQMDAGQHRTIRVVK